MAGSDITGGFGPRTDMNPADALIAALRSHAPQPTPHTSTVRACVRGRREFTYLPMGSGNGQAPVKLETGEELAAIAAERKAVEV